MTRIHAADDSMTILRARMRVIPIVSVVIGSLAPLLPIVASWPMLPPLGLLMLLGWRLLRPELWPLWIGLPLGLLDDLISGNPIGAAMLVWTLILIALDFADGRYLWRDYWFEWLIASGAISFYILASMLISAIIDGGSAAVWPLLPQLAMAILLVPLVLRLCARLDAWRLDL